jgi:two-component system OmpR family response regulator
MSAEHVDSRDDAESKVNLVQLTPFDRALKASALSENRSVLVLIEDSPDAEGVRAALKLHGYSIHNVQSRSDTLRAALTGDASILIVDRMLHGLDGLAVVKAMRDEGITMPVVVISSFSSVDERIRGLEAGCDDYLAKPFAMNELMARIGALVRRAGHMRARMLRVGPLEMDFLHQMVKRGDRVLALLPREFKILEYFMRHPDEIVARVTLLREVWGYNVVPLTNVVDVHLSNIRRKIDVEGEPPLIASVRRAGFVLRVKQTASPRA